MLTISSKAIACNMKQTSMIYLVPRNIIKLFCILFTLNNQILANYTCIQ